MLVLCCQRLLLAFRRPLLLLQPGGAPVPLPVVSAVTYSLTPLPASWVPLQVAQALLDDAKAQKLASLLPPLVEAPRRAPPPRSSSSQRTRAHPEIVPRL